MDDDEKLITAFRELHAELLALGGDQGRDTTYSRAADRIRDLRDDVERLRGAFFKSQAEVCDTLGRALGYPFYKDDPENFPGATSEADGVCTGDHVAETIAAEAADRLSALKAERDRMAAALGKLADDARWWKMPEVENQEYIADACMAMLRLMRACARAALSQEPTQ